MLGIFLDSDMPSFTGKESLLNQDHDNRQFLTKKLPLSY